MPELIDGEYIPPPPAAPPEEIGGVSVTQAIQIATTYGLPPPPSNAPSERSAPPPQSSPGSPPAAQHPRQPRNATPRKPKLSGWRPTQERPAAFRPATRAHPTAALAALAWSRGGAVLLPANGPQVLGPRRGLRLDGYAPTAWADAARAGVATPSDLPITGRTNGHPALTPRLAATERATSAVEPKSLEPSHSRRLQISDRSLVKAAGGPKFTRPLSRGGETGWLPLGVREVCYATFCIRTVVSGAVTATAGIGRLRVSWSGGLDISGQRGGSTFRIVDTALDRDATVNLVNVLDAGLGAAIGGPVTRSSSFRSRGGTLRLNPTVGASVNARLGAATAQSTARLSWSDGLPTLDYTTVVTRRIGRDQIGYGVRVSTTIVQNDKGLFATAVIAAGASLLARASAEVVGPVLFGLGAGRLP